MAARRKGPKSPATARGALDAALYIAALAAELSRLAKRHDLETLAYILDMARLEANQISQRIEGDEPFSASR